MRIRVVDKDSFTAFITSLINSNSIINSLVISSCTYFPVTFTVEIKPDKNGMFIIDNTPHSIIINVHDSRGKLCEVISLDTLLNEELLSKLLESSCCETE